MSTHDAVEPDEGLHPPCHTEKLPLTPVSRPDQAGSIDTKSGLEYYDDPTYPEGGLRAWTQVLATGSNLLSQIAWGYPSIFSVELPYCTETMGLSSAQISWIGSIQVFLAFSICIIYGRLSDAGYCRHVTFVGSVLAVLGTFMTSLCTEYWQTLLATGFGLGIMFMPGIAIVRSNFKERRALALSIAATGSGIGSCIFLAAVNFNYLIPQIGFPWAIRCQGFLALGVAAVPIVFSGADLLDMLSIE